MKLARPIHYRTDDGTRLTYRDVAPWPAAERSMRVVSGLDRDGRPDRDFVFVPQRSDIDRAHSTLNAAKQAFIRGWRLPERPMAVGVWCNDRIVGATPREVERLLETVGRLPAFVGQLIPEVRLGELETYTPFDGDVVVNIARDWVNHDSREELAVVLAHESGHCLVRALCARELAGESWAQDFVKEWERACLSDSGIATVYAQLNVGEDIAESLVVLALSESDAELRARMQRLMPARVVLLRRWLAAVV